MSKQGQQRTKHARQVRRSEVRQVQAMPTNQKSSDFAIGDAVRYTGSTFKSELYGKAGPVKGWVHSKCLNQSDMIIVEFSELKHPDFIIHESNLKRWTDKATHDPYEVAPRRKKSEDEVK